MINKGRINKIKDGSPTKGPVVYWMSRDQRIDYNWALLFAYTEAREKDCPLVVVFCLVDNFLSASKRAYLFMFEGLKEVEIGLNDKGIDFVILLGNPVEKLPEFLKTIGASILITDFDPLKIKRFWKIEVSKQIEIPFYEVDTHNIVPCWLVSSKQEYGAYTIRRKINKNLKSYLDDFPNIKKLTSKKLFSNMTDWNVIYDKFEIKNEKVFFKSGSQEAKKRFKEFINYGLQYYSIKRNDPTVDGQSNLSPYLHFGQIASQYIAMTLFNSHLNTNDVNCFLEELIVRKELSDNFCLYNGDYDNFNGLPQWAKDSLLKHAKDKREYLYDENIFEKAQTHDDLWNAAQMEMVIKGKMHGYMRMYWAKKILQWSESPQEAIKIAVILNDKYSIDGRDPNGYAGILWSIGGLHDRAYNERAVFGKIRYMSYEGCKRKFKVNDYIDKWTKEVLIDKSPNCR
ncbi:MAG: deoxyribodipyrimidine photo-lyase [Thermodesulfovibrionales bacterium]|nr:deoxyribodipyrimidine photo-lyase [Thermodesulfovibrionales bacterium]